MNNEQVGAVLAKIQTFDNRTIDKLTIMAWRDAIGNLDYQDALDAVSEHFRTSTEYLKPGHITAIVRSRRNVAAQHAPIEGADKSGAPRPVNMAALEAAWRDPQRWAAEIEKYNQQLEDAGFERLPGWMSDAYNVHTSTFKRDTPRAVVDQAWNVRRAS